MAGAVLERELAVRRTNRVEFTVATQADDAEIRRLLRENPMPGRISLTLEREPDYFADAHLPAETKQTIIARLDGRVMCAGSCAIRPRFVNGQLCRVGYLGGLRLDARYAGRFDVVRCGYEFFRELHADAPADFYFTSIATDNERARRLLERGLPGMPKYGFVGEFVTALLSTNRGARIHSESPSEVPVAEEIVPLLNQHNSFFQLAPSWSAEELTALEVLGLQTNDFHSIRRNGRVVACAAIWDQRTFKQTVIQGYDPWLAALRPIHNLAARFFGGPKLPDIRTTLAQAFLSHLVADVNEPEMLVRLIAELSRVAAKRGIELLTAGFAAHDPRLAILRRHFQFREYRSRLYVVRWPDSNDSAAGLKDSILAPEVALL